MLYIGNMVNCHSQAALTLLMKQLSFENLIYFEIATSVPFGLVYKPGDPNRILDSYIDPDIGIDNAFDIFSIPFEIKYWNKAVDSKSALEQLDDWLKFSPVLLGPINMGELDYLPQGNMLYSGIDHYIVVIEKNVNGYYISDPEGMPFVYISRQQLNKACISGQLEEGRGSYTIRRVLNEAWIDGLALDDERLDMVRRAAFNNYMNASLHPNGGSNGLRKFADDIECQLGKPSVIAGLRHVLTNRIQRSLISIYFFKLLTERAIYRKIVGKIEQIIENHIRQQRLYGVFLLHICGKDNINPAVIKEIIIDIAILEESIAAYANGFRACPKSLVDEIY